MPDDGLSSVALLNSVHLTKMAAISKSLKDTELSAELAVFLGRDSEVG
jgi:hypothetical protein